MLDIHNNSVPGKDLTLAVGVERCVSGHLLIICICFNDVYFRFDDNVGRSCDKDQKDTIQTL